MAKKQSLGRGLDSLIPQEVDVTILTEDKDRVQKLLITDIVPNPAQPRLKNDKTALSELTSSVKRHGILQPIIVVPHQRGYRIVAGERRWRAARAAGLKHIPSIIRSLAELEQIELALIENIQRVDLSPLEQAMSVFKLQRQFNLTLEDIAQKLGKAPSTVSNIARLLQLPDEARLALQKGKISEGHARAILALRGDIAKQSELLRYILNNNWTVRQAEQFAVAAKRGANIKKATSRTASETELTKNISQNLGHVVKIEHMASKIQLIIELQSEKQIAEIAKKLQN